MTDPTTSERPTSAGMYDFYLGGSNHRPIDRAAAEQIVSLVPAIGDGASANRGFLQRAVNRLADEQGIRQFLDIGSGLPTQRNTHDVVLESQPTGRIVYVDIDPMVVSRSAELLSEIDTVTVIEGDVRGPEQILGHPETRRLIDFSEPVAVMLVAVLHFVSDDDEPWELVHRYLSEVPSGSYLVLSHSAVGAQVSDQTRELTTKIYASTPNPPTDRSKTEIERFFEGLELVTPYKGAGQEICHVGLWGAEDPGAADSEGSRMGFAGVGRKP